MTEKVREQILAIRDTGLTNMFDIPMVQRLAYDRGYYELVCWLEDLPIDGNVRTAEGHRTH